jgi:hypothetical protein
VLFVVLSMTLAILSGKRHGSVMEDVTPTEPSPVTESTAPEGAVAAPETGDPGEQESAPPSSSTAAGEPDIKDGAEER